MSVLQIVSVYDSAAEAYSKIFLEQSKGSALRAFMDAASNKDSSIAQHPEHYSMFHLGSFNLVTAKFDLLPSPELIAKAWELAGEQK